MAREKVILGLGLGKVVEPHWPASCRTIKKYFTPKVQKNESSGLGFTKGIHLPSSLSTKCERGSVLILMVQIKEKLLMKTVKI